jgi:hypothetical protein
MTTSEMIIDVQLKMSKLNGNDTRKLEDENIIWFLNDSMRLLFRKYLIKSQSGFFDVDEVHHNIYNPFIELDVLLDKESILQYKTPDECYLLLGGYGIVDGKRVKLTKIKTSLINIISDTPYYKGGSNFLNVLQFKKHLKVVSSDTLIEKLFINYIRNPDNITSAKDCEFDLMYHSIITDLTVENLLANVRDIEGYKIKAQTNNDTQILIK